MRAGAAEAAQAGQNLGKGTGVAGGPEEPWSRTGRDQGRSREAGAGHQAVALAKDRLKCRPKTGVNPGGQIFLRCFL